MKDSEAVPDLEEKLERALEERNRLAHRFFRQHNFRINSDEGRSVMYRDLEAIHRVIFDAYSSLIEATHGIDLDDADPPAFPTKHVSL